MKKSVILIITTMSLVAIIIIGLLFQRAEIYNETQLVQEIIVTNIRVGDDMFPTFWDSGLNKYRIQNPDPEKPEAIMNLPLYPNLTVDILYSVLPIDATNQSVSFIIDVSPSVAEVDDTGRVTFTETERTSASATITINAEDNSNVRTAVYLRAKIPGA
jgi:hypothetical protein